MTEYSLQPNFMHGRFERRPGSTTIPDMPKKHGPHKITSRSRKASWLPFLKSWRVDRGMTVADLAEASGISTGQISGIENGSSGPSSQSRAALAKALRITVAMLEEVDPAAGDSIWSIWERASPAERAQIEAVAAALVKPK